MRPTRDSTLLHPPWHVDCRIAAELPEEGIVGTRFLIKTALASGVGALLLLCGWLTYAGVQVRSATGDWERRIADNRSELRELQRLRREYAAEAAKIEQACALVKSPLVVSDFVAQIGRTRPAPMTIDIIETNGDNVVMRGSLRESSERASRLLGSYVAQLRQSPGIGPCFREIALSGLDRLGNDDLLSFEITFRPRPAPP